MNILTEEEVKKILDRAFTGTADELFVLKKGKIIPALSPTMVSNGYIVAMNIDDKGKTRVLHVSISNPDGPIDPAESDAIASDILGGEYETIPGVILPNMFHYLKTEYVDDKKETKE